MQPGWELYRSFLAVMREGSLSAAARSLALTQPTIGRHIDALEEALGVTLFTRSQTGLIATEGALGLMPFAEAMASAAEALQRAATGEAEDDSGTVRITASEMVGVEVLPALLAEFRELHPRIRIEVLISNRTEDLLRREADIAIRMIRPTQSALVARKVGVVKLGLHAHPDYLKKYGAPKTIEEVMAHPLIGFDRVPSIRRLENFGIELNRDLFAYRTDSDAAQYAALRAGFGLGFCQRTLGRRDGLTPLLEGELGVDLDVWVAMHEDLKTSRRMRLMFDFLAEALSLYVKEP